MAHKWLDGWKTSKVFDKTLPYNLSPESCELIKEVCEKLVGLGALPNGGIGGNFGIRYPKTLEGFFVTAAGSEKNNLKKEDFILVHHLHWEWREIVFFGAEGKMPSTDSLLIAKTFAADPSIHTWAHFHKPLNTQYAVKLNYPALDEKEWQKLTDQIASGARIVNLIGHVGSEDIPDAAIVLGKDAKETFELSLKLVQDDLYETTWLT